MRVALLQRAVKFGISGAVCTGIAYVTLMLLLPLTNFVVAASVSWAASALCGFAINRRFTFGIRGPDGRRRDLALFLLGAGLQYLVSMAGYWVLLKHLKLNPTAAFVLNLGATTTFSFAYLNLVAFRRAPVAQAPPRPLRE